MIQANMGGEDQTVPANMNVKQIWEKPSAETGRRDLAKTRQE